MEAVHSDEEPSELTSSLPANEYQFSKMRELLHIYQSKQNEVLEIRPEEPWLPRVTSLEFTNYEKSVGIMELTGSEGIGKVFGAFVYLISEARLAKNYVLGKVIHALNFYSEGVTCEIDEGDPEVMIGRSLQFLRDTFENLVYFHTLVANFVRQIHAFYNKKQHSYKKSHLISVFDAIGSVLSCLVYIDAVVSHNENLTNHWSFYKRMMQFVTNAPGKYGISSLQEKQLRKCLLYLDKVIMNANCLEECLSQLPQLEMNKELHTEFLYYFRVKLDRVFGTLDGPYEWEETSQVIESICTYILYRKLFPKEWDAKLFRMVWMLQQKTPAVVVTGQVLVFPSELLSKHAKPLKTVKLDPKDPEAHLLKFLDKSDACLVENVKTWSVKFSLWVTRMQSFFANSGTNSLILHENRGKLLIQGILLAGKIRNYIQLNTALHQLKEVPFKADFVPSLMKAIDTIKAISSTFERIHEMVAIYLPCMTKTIIHAGLQPLGKIKHKSDVKIPCQMMLNTLQGVVDWPRVDVLKICSDFIDMKGLLNENDRTVISDAVWKLEILVDYQTHLANATDCSFIYWTQELNPHILRYFYLNPSNIHRLKYFYMALEDAVKHMNHSTHSQEPIEKPYISERVKELNEFIVNPLAEAIESDLRSFIHSLYVSEFQKPNPLTISNISLILECSPIIFCEKSLDIKREIELYLERTFYNMTAMNLNDWEVYEEMSSLAKQRFGLVLGENRLPPKQLDQGMGLLEITRSLPKFIGKFKYNLHSQFFIESTTAEEKNVECVTYMHIMKSLKTHGLGLVNTTINYSYKLLAKRFQIFSSFLYDEHIYSYLVKDSRFFEKNLTELNNQYPYERPESFLKDIKRLGSVEGGLSYIDKFRQLITQMGNILGLIRMIKTGALNHTATTYYPGIPKYSQVSHKYSHSTQQALLSLDKINDTIKKNYSEDSDYFAILVDTFKGVLNSSGADHLKLFYMIIPALSINFIESLLVAKDKLKKKKATDMYFSDDGFTMGLAYILRVLEQESKFDSLHWFESVDKKLETDSESEENQKMHQISAKKIQGYKEEYELFKYCFLGARIFFNS